VKFQGRGKKSTCSKTLRKNPEKSSNLLINWPKSVQNPVSPKKIVKFQGRICEVSGKNLTN